MGTSIEREIAIWAFPLKRNAAGIREFVVKHRVLGCFSPLKRTLEAGLRKQQLKQKVSTSGSLSLGGPRSPTASGYVWRLLGRPLVVTIIEGVNQIERRRWQQRQDFVNPIHVLPEEGLDGVKTGGVCCGNLLQDTSRGVHPIPVVRHSAGGEERCVAAVR